MVSDWVPFRVTLPASAASPVAARSVPGSPESSPHLRGRGARPKIHATMQKPNSVT